MGWDHAAIAKWKLSGAPIDYDQMSKWVGFDTEGVDTMKQNVGKKTKIKTVIYEVTPEILDMLDRKVEPVPQSMFEQNPEAAVFHSKIKEQILMMQDMIRREYEIKGYGTYQVEVTDDDEEVEDAAAHGQTEDAAPIAPHHREEYEIVTSPVPLARGRRRYRPGVVKQASGCKKLA